MRCIRVVVLQQQRLHRQPVCSGRVRRGPLNVTCPDQYALTETNKNAVFDEAAYDMHGQAESGGHVGGATDPQTADA